MTIGLYMQELIRHVDPGHRTLGRFFAEEIAKPLEIEFYIGLPPEIPDERLAQLRTFTPGRAIRALPSVPKGYVMRILWPWSLLRKSMLFADADPNDRRWLEVEVPAGNGVGTARAIARAYSAFAEGGAELGITPATLGSLTAVSDPERPRDEVHGCAQLDVARLPPTGTAARIGARVGAPSARRAPAARLASPILTHGSASPT